jgi:hypothetical protein
LSTNRCLLPGYFCNSAGEAGRQLRPLVDTAEADIFPVGTTAAIIVDGE